MKENVNLDDVVYTPKKNMQEQPCVSGPGMDFSADIVCDSMDEAALISRCATVYFRYGRELASHEIQNALMLDGGRLIPKRPTLDFSVRELSNPVSFVVQPISKQEHHHVFFEKNVAERFSRVCESAYKEGHKAQLAYIRDVLFQGVGEYGQMVIRKS